MKPHTCETSVDDDTIATTRDLTRDYPKSVPGCVRCFLYLSIDMIDMERYGNGRDLLLYTFNPVTTISTCAVTTEPTIRNNNSQSRLTDEKNQNSIDLSANIIQLLRGNIEKNCRNSPRNNDADASNRSIRRRSVSMPTCSPTTVSMRLLLLFWRFPSNPDAPSSDCCHRRCWIWCC